MIRQILLSIVFSIGILYSVYEVLCECKANKRKYAKDVVTYKMRYYSLWIIIFVYLIYMQWAI
jgi:hypothetical protein